MRLHVLLFTPARETTMEVSTARGDHFQFEGEDSCNFMCFQNQIAVRLTGQPQRSTRRVENIPASNWFTVGLEIA
jgi:hypothetical protein